MAKKRERVAALAAALLFLLTSVGATGFVIWQVYQEHKNATPATTNTTPEAKLQGTKLNNFTPVASVDSLQIIDLVPGTGTEVKATDTVTAHYTGALAKTGIIFESSHDTGQPATFPLANVIAGWQQGVPGMKVGGTRRLLIPSNLAYGETGSPPKIGPNEPLVFDIELVSVKQ